MSSYYPARFLTRYIHTTINNRGRPRSQRRDPMLQSSRRKLVFAVLFHILSHMATQVQVNTHTPVERSLMYGLHIDRVRDRAWPGLACTPSPEPREWVVPLPAAGTKNMLTRTVDGRIETSNSDLMFPSSTLPFLFFPLPLIPSPLIPSLPGHHRLRLRDEDVRPGSRQRFSAALEPRWNARLPAWINHRGISIIWTGRARARDPKFPFLLLLLFFFSSSSIRQRETCSIFFVFLPQIEPSKSRLRRSWLIARTGRRDRFFSFFFFFE